MPCPRRWSACGLAVLLIGCAKGSVVLPDAAYRVERGASSIVVVEVPRDGDLAAPGRQVGRWVATELSLSWFNVLDRDLLLRAHPELAPPLLQAAQQILLGGQPAPEISERLFRLHGVGQLLLVDVFRYEQLWGGETRVTRVGVEARLVLLADGRTLWQGRTDPEISGAPGSGFELAGRRAAKELVRLLSDGWPRLEDTPMVRWPVLEYFTAN